MFLRDAFFGIGPGDLWRTIGAYESEATWHPNPDNWYTSYILPSLALPFLLYLLSGIRPTAKAVPMRVRLVWLIPLLLAVLLTISLIRSNWGVKPTYFLPALPVIAILAAQVLDFDRPRTHSEVAGVCWLSLLGGLALVGFHLLVVRLSALHAVGCHQLLVNHRVTHPG